MTRTMIDLKKITEGKSILLSGHVRGVTARKFFELDKIDVSSDGASIVAPDNLEAITTSFVQGFMGDSMLNLHDSKMVLSKYDISTLPPSLQRDFKIGLARLGFQR